VRAWLEEHITFRDGAWLLNGAQFATKASIEHADPFFSEWLELSAKLYGRSEASRVLFDSLTGRLATSCMKCHSVDIEAVGDAAPALRVNWRAEFPESDFTVFNHAPHVQIPALTCNGCHSPVADAGRVKRLASEYQAISGEAAKLSAGDPNREALESRLSANDRERKPLVEILGHYLASFKDEKGERMSTNFERAKSNFAGLSRDLCMTCHTPRGAGDSCVMCHDYHVQDNRVRGGWNSPAELTPKRAAVPPVSNAESEDSEPPSEPTQ
jgi:hypothetical protein